MVQGCAGGEGDLEVGDHQNIAALDTEGLIGMQVTQLEKEKEKELAEQLRIVAKRQQAVDRATFATVGTARQEAAHGAPLHVFETKEQLAQMLPEYEKRRAVVLAKKGEEYAKRKDAAA
ncbi:hypothetical protein B0H11DRAFT_2257626 [Mycena galericulata]|nr:hypothetical protein B0H11DRAFT_2257626 [Mycena galericulata]